MFEPVTELTIEAPPSVVWRILADTAGYPAWNPLIVRFDGELRQGARAKLTVGFGARRSPKIAVRVDVVEPNVELAWTGGPRAILRGTHYFRLDDLGGGRTRFVHGERFVGALSRVLPLMRKNFEAGYRAMNRALAREAEGAAKAKDAVA